MRITNIPTVNAKEAHAAEITWAEIVERCTNPPSYPTKAACPLIKLATFGEQRTAKGCLRHDANVLTITGLECDYDGEKMPPSTARMLIERAGITALVYTSPSHTEAAPRWRVLAPLSTECPPTARRELVGRINGVLGGILANESFTLSQSFYIGRVEGMEYEAYATEGDFIDRLPSLPAVYPAKAAPVHKPLEYVAQGAGIATLDQLDDVARNQYAQFLGPVPRPWTLSPMPEHVKAWDEPRNIVPSNDNKHARRARLTSSDDSDVENDKSAADYALACDLLQEGFKPDIVEIIMRATRYRPKFDEMRNEVTYIARTIGKAMSSVAAGNKTPPEDLPILSLEQGRISIPTTPPAPRDYVWEKRMVAGHAYALGGFGGVSKSQAALQFAASIAMGIPFGNISTKKGSALLIFGEDDLSEINRRIGAYAALGVISPTKRRELEKNIRTFGLVGVDARLTVTIERTLTSTSFAANIITAAAELAEQSGEPICLIVLDHAGLFHGGDFNAREDVSLTMRIINHVAHETGAAVLLLAHSPKAAGVSETSDASAIAGSTAFVDQTRGAFILATMRKSEAKVLGITESMRQQYVSLAVVKNNYGKTGEVSWFTRTSPPGWEVGVLVPVDLQPPVKSITPNAAVVDRVKQFITDHPGQHSKNSLRENYGRKDGALKASKPKVAAAVDDLIHAGEIISRSPTAEEREKFALSHKTTAVLDVPAKGD